MDLIPLAFHSNLAIERIITIFFADTTVQVNLLRKRACPSCRMHKQFDLRQERMNIPIQRLKFQSYQANKVTDKEGVEIYVKMYKFVSLE